MAELLTINKRDLQAILDLADDWKREVPRRLRRGNKMLMRGLGTDARKRIRFHIKREQTPDGKKWPPLKPITQHSIPGNTKAKVRGKAHMLRDTRQYWNSIKVTKHDGLSVVVEPTGTNKPRFGKKASPNAVVGRAHHLGQSQAISLKASKFLAHRKKIHLKAGTVAKTPSRAHFNLQDDPAFKSHVLMKVAKWVLRVSTRKKK